MSLNKTRKRLIRKLEDRERKLLSISEFLRMFEEILLETRKANLRRLLVLRDRLSEVEKFLTGLRGGGINGLINGYIRALISCVAGRPHGDRARYVERRTRR